MMNEAKPRKDVFPSGWSFDKVVSALNFLAVPTEIPLGRVVLDSREVQKGDIFVALKGEHYDGHDFLQQAYDNGAGLTLVERSDLPLLEHHSYLCVTSTRQALVDLAAYARAHTAATVVAVSGSVGKTTVRTWIYQLLDVLVEGAATMTLRNFNGQLGLPLSLTQLEPATRFGVFEVGIDTPRTMAPLAKLCQPHVAVLTPVGMAHRERFASAEELAQEKAQLFTGLCPGGMAIIDAASAQTFPILRQVALEAGVDVLTVGPQEEADVRLLGVRVGTSSTQVEVDVAGWRVEYTIDAVGEEMALDSALALTTAIGALYPGRLKEIVAEHQEELESGLLPTLSKLSALPGRGRIFSTMLPGGRTITVLDDAYNASMASMLRGLKALECQPSTRRIAVVGDMLELGEDSKRCHQQLFDKLAESSVEKVFAVGPLTKAPFATLPTPQQGAWLPTKDGLLDLLEQECQSGDAVWLKASHALALHEIVTSLYDEQRKDLAA